MTQRTKQWQTTPSIQEAAPLQLATPDMAVASIRTARRCLLVAVVGLRPYSVLVAGAMPLGWLVQLRRS
jgi:hypothetical protein